MTAVEGMEVVVVAAAMAVATVARDVATEGMTAAVAVSTSGSAALVMALAMAVAVTVKVEMEVARLGPETVAVVA